MTRHKQEKYKTRTGAIASNYFFVILKILCAAVSQ